MIEAAGLTYHYPSAPDRPVVRDVSWQIKAGECWVLTGPSGSGKSTLARLLAGFLRPQAGSVRVEGADRTAQPSRDVLVIHQDSDLFPWQRARRQIQFAQRSGAPDRSAELLKLVKLEGFADYYPAQLSGGMKKRLALARALAAQPKLLILDEAFSSLDRPLRAELIGDLRRIWETTRISLLFITHDDPDFAGFQPRELRLTSPLTSLQRLRE